MLKALALNIPVVATTACGLPPMENLILIPAGDYTSLKNAVEEAILEKKDLLDFYGKLKGVFGDGKDYQKKLRDQI